MKKFICLILTLVMSVSVVSVYAENDISLKLDGNFIETPISPEIKDGRTMVPFRSIFEALGMRVEWSESHRKISAFGDETTIILTIDSNIMIVNATVSKLDASPYISNNYSLVPARAICEALGCTVEWDEPNRCVIIRTKNYVEPAVPEQPAQPEQPSQPTQPEYTPVIDDNPSYINKNNTKLPGQVVELINNERIANDLAPLELDENVAEVAKAHCKDMAAYDYIDHISPSGSTPAERLDMAGIYYMSAAENIASGFLTAEDVVKSWMNSEKHRDNILNFEFTHIGVGYYAGGSNGTYWTLVMISR